MTRESLIDWASSWVPDTSPMGEPGQRERFKSALTEELKDWSEPVKKPRFCKHCPFAEHLHDGNGTVFDCPGFEAQ